MGIFVIVYALMSIQVMSTVDPAVVVVVVVVVVVGYAKNTVQVCFDVWL